MNYYEKTIRTEPVHKGFIFDIERLTVELPNGKAAYRDVIRHSGASVIVPITEDGHVILVEQYRKPVEEVSLELPAGRLNEGEDPARCAARELKEETGYTASRLVKILTLYPAAAYSDEVLHVYVATGLSKGEASPDEDEVIQAFKYKMDDVIKMIMDGAIKDSKTVSGILFTVRLLETGNLKL
ncbi:MAG TPA: NUDIX hydrolase [Thermoclostridium sp.]|nr:NUDIX hydrolase [Clostridiaceae bacterium]HOQ76433.1 NUDIX hydrolase [Thermoclostridium sp.]HPU45100.1 NUDIX hydrolase [Thermoclostridium sp.]